MKTCQWRHVATPFGHRSLKSASGDERARGLPNSSQEDACGCRMAGRSREGKTISDPRSELGRARPASIAWPRPAKRVIPVGVLKKVVLEVNRRASPDCSSARVFLLMSEMSVDRSAERAQRVTWVAPLVVSKQPVHMGAGVGVNRKVSVGWTAAASHWSVRSLDMRHIRFGKPEIPTVGAY